MMQNGPSFPREEPVVVSLGLSHWEAMETIPSPQQPSPAGVLSGSGNVLPDLRQEH